MNEDNLYHFQWQNPYEAGTPAWWEHESKKSKILSGLLVIFGVLLVGATLGLWLGKGFFFAVLAAFILWLSKKLFDTSEKEKTKAKEVEDGKTTDA